MAAMAFMGCTGRGMPKVTPVIIFVRPENTKVAERDIDFVKVRAMSSGRRVPRSPREPESSARGFERRVLKLCALMRRRRAPRTVIMIELSIFCMNKSWVCECN